MRQRGRPPGSVKKRRHLKKLSILNDRLASDVTNEATVGQSRVKSASSRKLKRRSANSVHVADVNEEDNDMFRCAQQANSCLMVSLIVFFYC